MLFYTAGPEGYDHPYSPLLGPEWFNNLQDYNILSQDQEDLLSILNVKNKNIPIQVKKCNYLTRKVLLAINKWISWKLHCINYFFSVYSNY